MKNIEKYKRFRELKNRGKLGLRISRNECKELLKLKKQLEKIGYDEGDFLKDSEKLEG